MFLEMLSIEPPTFVLNYFYYNYFWCQIFAANPKRNINKCCNDRLLYNFINFNINFILHLYLYGNCR